MYASGRVWEVSRHNHRVGFGLVAELNRKKRYVTMPYRNQGKNGNENKFMRCPYPHLAGYWLQWVVLYSSRYLPFFPGTSPYFQVISPPCYLTLLYPYRGYCPSGYEELAEVPGRVSNDLQILTQVSGTGNNPGNYTRYASVRNLPYRAYPVSHVG